MSPARANGDGDEVAGQVTRSVAEQRVADQRVAEQRVAEQRVADQHVAEQPVASPVDVRLLRRTDSRASARLHREVLEAEFLAGAGERFLRLYHLAWCDSPDGLALAAVDSSGEIVGVLLGTLRPASHYSWMARRYGFGLALRMVEHAISHPRFARDLVITRAVRYARGALRVLGRRRARGHEVPPGGKEGEITHLMVSQSTRGAGAGRALVHEALRAARDAGLDQVVLVTPPDLAGRGFYEHLGWLPDGAVTSRSGERFVRYRWPLLP